MHSDPYSDPERLEELAGLWLARIGERVPPRPHLRPEVTRAALLVIDMLRYFADPAGRCFRPAAAAITPNLSTLLARWRQTGGTVVFTRHSHEGPHDLGMLGRFFSDYIHAGEPDSEIIEPLTPLPGEPVLRKTTYDAFLNTGLQELLEEKGVEQVVVTGVLTHMCCETTARSAFCRGFEVYVPVDAVATSTEEKHVGSLLSMADSVAVLVRSRDLQE